MGWTCPENERRRYSKANYGWSEGSWETKASMDGWSVEGCMLHRHHNTDSNGSRLCRRPRPVLGCRATDDDDDSQGNVNYVSWKFKFKSKGLYLVATGVVLKPEGSDDNVNAWLEQDNEA